MQQSLVPLHWSFFENFCMFWEVFCLFHLTVLSIELCFCSKPDSWFEAVICTLFMTISTYLAIEGQEKIYLQLCWSCVRSGLSEGNGTVDVHDIWSFHSDKWQDDNLCAKSRIIISKKIILLSNPTSLAGRIFNDLLLSFVYFLALIRQVCLFCSGKFGLWLDGDLYQGRTQRCSTYSNEPLAPQEDFVVKAMECWAFI
jgi:hypothetical protein